MAQATARIYTCVAAFTSTNNWDLEPVHLSLKNKIISLAKATVNAAVSIY